MNPTRVMVNGREVVIPGPEATPEQIKQAAGIDPNSMLVRQTPDANQFVQPGQRIKLAPGTHFADVPVFEYGALRLPVLSFVHVRWGGCPSRKGGEGGSATPGQADATPAATQPGTLREIVFTEPDYDALRTHLLSDPCREQHAFLLATPCANLDHLRLLVREVLPSAAGQLAGQSGAHLQVQRDHTIEVLERCHQEGLSLIEAHSHPFCATGVAFSSTDTGNERLKFPYVAERIPGIFHAAMVFGTDSVDAHLWDRLTRSVLPVDRLRVIGHPLQTIPTTSALRRARGQSILGWWRRSGDVCGAGALLDADDRARRQVLAFGQAGQERIASCRAGIVGAGGLGALVTQMLAHLGCRNLVLVDGDRVETTNLNRLVGATPLDATLGTPKVAVAARMAHQINPQAQVLTIRGKVQTLEAQEALKSCDVIFGALDNHGARLVLNQLCVHYLIPLIDMGTGIRVGKEAPLQAGGQVRLVIPGGFCLECIGGIDKQRAAYDLMSPGDQERQRVRGYVQGADVPAPAVIFLNSTVAAIAVQEFVNLLCGFKPAHRLIHWDAVAATARPLEGGERRQDCVVCGAGQVLGMGDLAQTASAAQPPQEAPAAA